jgi:hypothetical protein
MRFSIVTSMGAVAVACLLVPAAARADWQYTKWGMEQVCNASHGEVTMRPLSPNETDSTERLATLASGVFETGKFKFFALFDFDRTERKLEKVTLLYTASPDKPPLSALLLALQEKYGIWSSHTVWIDRTDNYSLDFSTLGDIGFLHYEPLHQKERKGL